MSKMVKVFGFFGVEKFDIILYLTKVLEVFKKNVLVIDVAYEKSISSAIPNSDELPVFNYNSADFISSDESLKYLGDNYDFMFIDFGFNVNHPLVNKCDEIYFVTNMYINNTYRILDAKLADDQERFLIIRDVENYKAVPDVICSAFASLSITKDTCFKLQENADDHYNKLDCMYNDMKSLKAVSEEMITIILLILSQDFLEKDLRNAIKKLTSSSSKRR